MRRLLPLLLVACADQNFGLGSPELTASPGLLDLGEIPVGSETTGRIALVQRYGAVRVLDVNLLPTLGSGFVHEGPEPFDVDPDDGSGVDVVFRPTEVGYASAIVQLLTDAREPVTEVEIRARGVAARLSASPTLVDLGVVPLGAEARADVELHNEGELGLVLREALSTRADVDVPTAFPIVLPAGGRFVVSVRYAAASIAPVQAWVSFVAGSAVVQDVLVVRANDCERGLPEAYDVDRDGYTSCGGDCDDGDADRHPSAVEVADGVDQDCDDVVDEGTEAFDDDGDGWCEGPMDCVGSARPGDCHDGDAALNPRADELLDNGVDDDCDGQVDPGGRDGDGDGYGPEGGDCDDADARRHPGARERPDGVDEDCDGTVDEGTVAHDDDGDGWCEGPGPCVGDAAPGDCDDADPTRFPGAEEQPDHVDDDCDGTVDEGTERGDDDGDGFTEVGGDCDDADPDRHPANGACPRP